MLSFNSLSHPFEMCKISDCANFMNFFASFLSYLWFCRYRIFFKANTNNILQISLTSKNLLSPWILHPWILIKKAHHFHSLVLVIVILIDFKYMRYSVWLLKEKAKFHSTISSLFWQGLMEQKDTFPTVLFIRSIWNGFCV